MVALLHESRAGAHAYLAKWVWAAARRVSRIPLAALLDHPLDVPGLEGPGTFGLLALGPAVQLAAGEDHLVDLVGAVGEAQHAAEAPERGQRGVVGHPEAAVDL